MWLTVPTWETARGEITANWSRRIKTPLGFLKCVAQTWRKSGNSSIFFFSIPRMTSKGLLFLVSRCTLPWSRVLAQWTECCWRALTWRMRPAEKDPRRWICEIQAVQMKDPRLMFFLSLFLQLSVCNTLALRKNMLQLCYSLLQFFHLHGEQVCIAHCRAS